MITALLLIAAQASVAPVAPDPRVAARVDRVLRKTPVIDGHNDLAWEIRDVHGAKVESLDLAADTRPLQTDIPRLRKGRVGAQFWSVWIPADMTGPRAVEMTLEQIDIVRRFVAANPAALERATSAADIRRIEKAGRIASLIGVEGGHQIDGRLSVLRQYRALGVGYMTLTHGKSLNWADSSTDAPRANGLTDFGRAVVAEMNRIGMIVDVSHVSDATMRAVLARALTDAPRDIPDDLLAAIGANGGIVMVNFYPAFVSTAWRAWDADRTALAKTAGVPANVYGARSPAPLVAWDRDHPEPRVTAATVADHVEHIARVAGRDHVGLGGDYDGINGTGPEGMTGVDGYPLLFAELARRGWSDADMARLAGGNMLRVMDATDAVARSLSELPPGDAIDIASR
jgi:membrane dipeptidase